MYILGSASKMPDLSKAATLLSSVPFSYAHVGTRVQVELNLSCRGVWGDSGDALAEGKKLVSDNLQVLRTTLDHSKAVYQQFISNCKEAGTFHSPEIIRREVQVKIEELLDPQYLAKALDMSAEEEEMRLPAHLSSPEYKVDELERSAQETGLESLSADNVFSAPVYCDQIGRWNIFLTRDNKIEWSVLNDDGGVTYVKDIDPSKVRLLVPEGEGRKVFFDYMSMLNARDSVMGYAYYLVDEYNYEDFLANTYYGVITTAALDLLWRASLIASLHDGKLDRKGMIEGIIAYDMDRLDAPTIGAFV